MSLETRKNEIASALVRLGLFSRYAFQMLPHLMQRISPAFALPLCSFKVERNKESTARVAIWRQLGVSRYTRRPLPIYLAKTTT